MERAPEAGEARYESGVRKVLRGFFFLISQLLPMRTVTPFSRNTFYYRNYFHILKCVIYFEIVSIKVPIFKNSCY